MFRVYSRGDMAWILNALHSVHDAFSFAVPAPTASRELVLPELKKIEVRHCLRLLAYYFSVDTFSRPLLHPFYHWLSWQGGHECAVEVDAFELGIMWIFLPLEPQWTCSPTSTAHHPGNHLPLVTFKFNCHTPPLPKLPLPMSEMAITRTPFLLVAFEFQLPKTAPQNFIAANVIEIHNSDSLLWPKLLRVPSHNATILPIRCHEYDNYSTFSRTYVSRRCVRNGLHYLFENICVCITFMRTSQSNLPLHHLRVNLTI